MTQPVPASIPADGSLKVLWVPTIADTTAPTVDELTAPEVVDLSCYLTDDGYRPNTDEQVAADNRLCSRQNYERIGRYTDQLDLTYIYRAQEPASATNKAFTTLKHRELGHVVERWGADYEDAVEAGDIVDVKPAECGVQRKQPPEANGRLRIMQKIFVRNAVQRDVAVVASS